MAYLLIHVVRLRWCHAHIHHSVHVCIGKVVLLHLLLLLLRWHSHLLLLDHHLLLLLGAHRVHLHVVGWRLRLSLARVHRWLTVMLKMRLHLHHGLSGMGETEQGTDLVTSERYASYINGSLD